VNVSGNIGVAGAQGGFGGDLRAEASTNVTHVPPEAAAPFPPLPEPADPPPVVEIVSPQDGASVSGVVLVKASGQGGNLRRAEFLIDGVLVKTDRGPNYDYSWDTTTAVKGPHTVAVTLYDAFGVKTSTSITVAVT
jgi:Bacterial Ig domain